MNFYKRADAIVLAFDLTSRSSFDNLDSWIKQFEGLEELLNAPKVLVGCKKDLNDARVINKEEAIKKGIM